MGRNGLLKVVLSITLFVFCLINLRVAGADSFIVEQGRPNAAIVIAEEPPRMVKLAARELQHYLEKISGALLPISTEPGDDYPVTLFIGQSDYTDESGITDEGLKYGAFRMVSGENRLVLLGKDFDFDPQLEAQARWEEETHGLWRKTIASRRRLNRETGYWAHDEGGSLNAVHEYLRRLGVRWYMPGDLGEVVPEMESIELPDLDEKVEPDYPLRKFFFSHYFIADEETILWPRRLGLNHGYEVLGSGMPVHGMRQVLGRKEMFEAHPEYYAVRGGQRDPGHACFSSEELVSETVNFVRATYDYFDEPAVDIWPDDGYRHCQCPECLGKGASEVVWEFIDKVAREVYKTHPDRLVTGGAYSQYRLPPETIDEFSPNVAVFLAHHRPGFHDPEYWGTFRENYMDPWLEKVNEGQLILNSNNYFNPLIHPRSYARDLKARKGKFLGDWNEVVNGPRGIWPLNPGINHLNLYVNSRLLWDAEQDIDELLDEYYELFYGPAAAEMKETFEFAENNYNYGPGRARFGLEGQIGMVERLHEAREAAGNTVYGERIALMLDELDSLENMRERLAERKKQAELRYSDAPLVLGRDADSDEDPEVYRMTNIEDGSEPDVETTFQVAWDDEGYLVFDFYCEEPDMENLWIDRASVWDGDSVAILLETPVHSYYQIEMNPVGDIFDADRQHGRWTGMEKWSSEAEIETEHGDDYWRVVVRFPVMSESEGATDPYHFMVGDRPTEERPWFFNVGRVRIRDLDKSGYMFSPTGTSYHELEYFARLVIEND